MDNLNLNGNVPSGDLADKWTTKRSTLPLVAPKNKLKIEISEKCEIFKLSASYISRNRM